MIRPLRPLLLSLLCAGLLAGCAAGLSLFSVSYFIAKHAVLAYSNGIYSWQPVFSIWPAFAACAVLAVIYLIKRRKNNKGGCSGCGS